MKTERNYKSNMDMIGVIGGLGPMASVYLVELITKMIDADTDQEHPRILMYSVPDIPDRTAFLLGESSDDPYPKLLETGRKLEEGGAGFIVIPCVTAQAFYERLQNDLTIPVLPLCADLTDEIRVKNIKKVAIFATSGTMKTGILEGELSQKNIDVVHLTDEEQSEVMRLIYDVVKTGKIYEDDEATKAYQSLMELSKKVYGRGAQAVILGCTELSIIRREAKVALNNIPTKDPIHIDVLERLAAYAIVRSGRKVRETHDKFPLRSSPPPT